MNNYHYNLGNDKQIIKWEYQGLKQTLDSFDIQLLT